MHDKGRQIMKMFLAVAALVLLPMACYLLLISAAFHAVAA